MSVDRRLMCTGAVLNGFEATERWLDTVQDVVDFLSDRVERRVDACADVKQAFIRGTARWTDEEINDELEYLIDQLNGDYLDGDVKLPTFDGLLKAFEEDLRGQAAEWRRLRDEADGE